MAAATWLAPRSKRRERVVTFEEEIFDVGVVTVRVKHGVLGEMGRLHVGGNVGHPSLQELHVILQLERHGKNHDTMRRVDESGVALEQGEERVVDAAEHNNLARNNTFSFSLLM